MAATAVSRGTARKNPKKKKQPMGFEEGREINIESRDQFAERTGRDPIGATLARSALDLASRDDPPKPEPEPQLQEEQDLPPKQGILGTAARNLFGDNAENARVNQPLFRTETQAALDQIEGGSLANPNIPTVGEAALASAVGLGVTAQLGGAGAGATTSAARSLGQRSRQVITKIQTRSRDRQIRRWASRNGISEARAKTIYNKIGGVKDSGKILSKLTGKKLSKLALGGLTGALALSSADMITNWAALDNVIGQASIETNEAVDAVVFGQMSKESAIEIIERNLEAAEIAQDKIQTSGTYNPAMMILGKVYILGSEQSIANINSDLERLRSLPDPVSVTEPEEEKKFQSDRDAQVEAEQRVAEEAQRIRDEGR